MRRERLLTIAFLLALILLAFIAGVAALRYDLFPAKTINNGITSAEALWQRNEATQPPTASNNGVEVAISNSRTQVDRNYAFPGYTLLTLRYSTTVYLIDLDGHVIHRWSMPFRKAWPKPSHVSRPVPEPWIYIRKAQALPNGDLIALYEGFGDTPYGYGIVKMDKDSKVIWTYSGNTHHDFYIDKQNGDIFTLTQRFIREAPPGITGLPFPMLADDIVQLSPAGKELLRISLLDAFRTSPFALIPYHAPKSALLWDHFHTNSIMKLEPAIAEKFPMFKPGQLLISIRNLNALAVVDPNTREVVWAYNGLWKAQHAAQFLDNGNILLMDNKGMVFDQKIYSRVLEINPATLRVNWYYTGGPQKPFFSNAFGDVKRLPNGNTLMTDSYNRRVMEIALNGQIVWQYTLPELVMRANVRPRKDSPTLNDNIYYEEPVDPNFNLSGVITSINRYTPEELTFLKR